MNTLIRQRNADGTEFEAVIDADPEDVQAEFERIDGHGMMIVCDRRSNEPSRTMRNNWTIYTSSLLAFEATDQSACPLPSSMLEVELRDAGRVYIESHGANREVLVARVQEAISAGMQVEAIAFLTGIAAVHDLI
jgi:hypothetical protein